MSGYLKTNKVKVNGITYEIEDSKTKEALENEVIRSKKVETELEDLYNESVDKINKLSKDFEDLNNELDQKVNDIVSDIVGAAPETLDTLQEIAEWIKDDESSTSTLLNKVDQIESNLNDVEDYEIEILWNNLLLDVNNSRLKPGRLYRITDYITTTKQEKTVSAGNRFDIVVEALSESNLSEIARVCPHSGDSYFSNNNLSAWEIKYCLKNDKNRFYWADTINGKGVIYYMKDEFNNIAWYDFKNIKFARNIDWVNSTYNLTGENYFYTFTRVENNTIIDDSLGTGSYKTSDNYLGRSTKNSSTEIPDTVFLGNGNFCNRIEDGHKGNTIGPNTWQNTIGFNFKNNNIKTNFQYNHIGSYFSGNIISGDFISNNIKSNVSNNKFQGSMTCCDIDSYVSTNEFSVNLTKYCKFGKGFTLNCFGNTENNNNNGIYYCEFGDDLKYISDLPNSMKYVKIESGILNSDTQIFLKNIITKSSQNLLDLLKNSINNTETLSVIKTTDGFDVLKKGDLCRLPNNIYYLGDFVSSGNAEDEAAKSSIAFDKNKYILEYSVGDSTGIIYQQISGDTCYQVVHWKGKRYRRTVTNTFLGTTKTDWVEVKDLTENDLTKLTKQVEVTWDELVNLSNNSNLSPGLKYRIIDYVTTTKQDYTKSAGHQFDIIVEALNNSELSEVAYACVHSGDNYFESSNLSAWELRYCLDNDTNRFAWADEENGKGVIYYMKDEWENECHYDFKNIKKVDLTENNYDTYYYTFSSIDSDYLGKDITTLGIGTCACHNNIIKEYRNEDDRLIYIDNVLFKNTIHFKNNSCHHNYVDNNSLFTVFNNGCKYITVGKDCSGLVFGEFNQHINVKGPFSNSYYVSPKNQSDQCMCETVIAQNSKGEVKIYCEADLLRTEGITNGEELHLFNAVYNNDTVEVTGLDENNETLEF